MSKFFENLKAGLTETLAYTQGKITLKSETIEIPEAPIEYKAEDIKKNLGTNITILKVSLPRS